MRNLVRANALIQLVSWSAARSFLLPWLMLVAEAGALDFNYTTNNGTITISAYTGPGGSVIIPDSIDGLLVTRIGSSAFYGLGTITSVTIPDSVTTVGAASFSNCGNLTNATIGKNVASIEMSAFEYCTSLPTVSIPGSVLRVGDSAFRFCTKLSYIAIGDGLMAIGGQSFESCKSLTGVVIPDSVTNIGSAAFDACTSLTNVSIGNNVISIEWAAFSLCVSLPTITIPNNVATIEEDAFTFCTSLTNVNIGNSVTNIGGGAFFSCSKLATINVNALNPCYSSVSGVLFNKSRTTLLQWPAGTASTYIIPENTTSIGDSAFASSPLSAVTIPNSVTNIGVMAFNSCGNLNTITLPSSVISIGYSAFENCTSLTRVTIGSGVTNIGFYAFASCASLSDVYFQGNAPVIDESVFSGDTNGTVYYLPGTIGWRSTFAGLPAAPWLPQIETSDSGFGVVSNFFGFNVFWASGMSVVVEATTNLADPTWVPLATNTLASGSLYFCDRQWTNYPGRFYRIRSP